MAVLIGDGGDNLLLGTTDSDTLIGFGGNDSLYGDGGNDTLIGGTGDDLLDGGDGSDTAVYTDAAGGITVDLGIGTAQAIGGGLGSDTLVNIENVAGSNFNDSLAGDDGANSLAGLGGDDVLEGRGGDDVLIGGPGSDTFKYSFTRTGGEGEGESFTGWLAEKGLATSGWTQSFFAKNYGAWLEHLVEDFGIGRDVDGDGRVRVGINQNDEHGTPQIEGLSAEELGAMFSDRQGVAIKTGKTSHDRFFSDTWSSGEGGEDSIASTDGHDTIVGFEWGIDKFHFDGLGADFSLVDFESAFEVGRSDANADGTLDTVLALSEGDWSVTLLGFSEERSEAEFYGESTFA